MSIFSWVVNGCDSIKASRDDRLNSSSATLANQPKSEFMGMARRGMIVGELSLCHLLSSKTSRVSVGNFQRTKYE